MKINGRLFVVTGGVSGLGLATVEKLVANGAYVAIMDVHDKEDVAGRLGSKARFYRVDVSNSSDIIAAITKILSWKRDIKIYIGGVVCCAGILGPAKILGKDNTPFSIESFKKVLDINVVGTIDVIRQLLPHIAIQEKDEGGERGVVITVSSAAAFDGQPGQVAYSAAKGAIASLTLPMARDLARHGIRAVSISPGLFETGMTTNMPVKAKESLQRVLEFPDRAGRPSEFAGLVQHILENSFLNGTVLRIDGATRMPSRI